MPGKPVVALDIDGTGGDYHAHFTWFAEQWTGRPMPDPTTINPGQKFRRHLGLSDRLYNQCKLAYRQGGLKRFMPIYPGFAEMTREFRRAGALVAICTTRPYLRLDNIDPDTQHWLRRNGVQYDWVIYGTNKYSQLLESCDPWNVVAALDDLVEMCDKAADLKLPAALRDQPYNRYNSGYRRVTDFTDDPWRKETLQAIREWKRQWARSG